MRDSDKQIREQVAVYWTKAQPAVSAFILSIVPQFHDANDILQQVATAVVKNFKKYDPQCDFVGWAIAIAKNEIRMHQRRHSKNKLILNTKATEKISEACEKESGRLEDISKALAFCINKLEGRGKQILEMRYLSEMSVSKIAQNLRMTCGSISAMLHRIRFVLQECINRQLSKERVHV